MIPVAASGSRYAGSARAARPSTGAAAAAAGHLQGLPGENEPPSH